MKYLRGLRTIREEAGLTQRELAERIGVERSSVAKWESGDAFPRGALVGRLAEALNCTIDDLYNGGKETDG